MASVDIKVKLDNPHEMLPWYSFFSAWNASLVQLFFPHEMHPWYNFCVHNACLFMQLDNESLGPQLQYTLSSTSHHLLSHAVHLESFYTCINARVHDRGVEKQEVSDGGKTECGAQVCSFTLVRILCINRKDFFLKKVIWN